MRAQDGEPWALEALFRKHVAPLTSLVIRLTSRHQDADDIVQDALAEALRDIRKLREPAAFRAWLHRIAVNRVRKRARRRKLTRMLGLDRGLEDATLYQLASPTATPEMLVELKLIDEALKELSSDERIAWILRHVEGQTLPEIAQVLGCSLATAKRRIASASEGLRRRRSP